MQRYYLKFILPSERSHMKGKYCMIPLIWLSEKDKTTERLNNLATVSGLRKGERAV
jgi:hypothetical protein